MAVLFEFASRVETIIGLIAFGMAIFLTVSLRRISTVRNTADQFSEEKLKLDYLKNNGKFVISANYHQL
jgi:hypothetical protein